MKRQAQEQAPDPDHAATTDLQLGDGRVTAEGWDRVTAEGWD